MSEPAFPIALGILVLLASLVWLVAWLIEKHEKRTALRPPKWERKRR